MRRIYWLILSCFVLVIVTGAQSPWSRHQVDSLIELTKKTYWARPDSSLQMAREVLSRSELIGYEEGRLLGLRWIGNSHYLLGRLDSASVYMLDLLDLAYDQNNLGIQADVMIDIGQTYDKIGMHTLAYDYFQQAHKIRMAMGDLERLSVTYINLAYHHYLLDELDSALYYYDKTFDIFDSIPPTHTTSFLYNEVGAVYLKQGRYEEAREYIGTAMELNRESRNNWDLCYDHLVLAELELEVGDIRAAEANIVQAMRISEESKVSVEYDLIYKMLSEVKSRQGRHKEALDYLTRSYQYTDSLNLALRDQKILALNHYKREKENQIATLKLTNESQQKDGQIDRQRALIVMIALVLLVSLGAAFVLLRKNQQLSLARVKIEDQNDDLKELNSAKGRLFSIVTHDIRNPLAHLNSMLKMARDGHITKDEFREFTGLLVDQTDRLTVLTETLIAWSKSQQSSLNPEKEKIYLPDLIKDSLEYIRPMAKDKSIELRYENGVEVGVQVDPTMMKLALNNLMTNAIKFTPGDGEVVIRTKAGANDIKIFIEDTGIGIDPNLIEDLKRGDVRTQRGTDNEVGTGIGLMLTLDLIVLNGGQLEAFNNDGKGSTFTITLPKG